MIDFGAGVLYGIQTHDVSGTAVSNPTPVQFGTLQEVSLDMSFENKKLYGNKQFPIAVGRGKGTIGLKAKMADIDGNMLANLFFGNSQSAGIKNVVNNFAAAVPATPGPYTVTIAPPNSGTFVKNLGVMNASTGLPLTRVASAPATGEYSVDEATGIYTFASADQGLGVLISYEYAKTGTVGSYGTISNQLMGYSPFFMVELSKSYQGKNLLFKFNRCTSSKLALPFKNEDFAMPDFEVDVMADDAGNIGTYAFS